MSYLETWRSLLSYTAAGWMQGGLLPCPVLRGSLPTHANMYPEDLRTQAASPQAQPPPPLWSASDWLSAVLPPQSTADSSSLRALASLPGSGVREGVWAGEAHIDSDLGMLSALPMVLERGRLCRPPFVVYTMGSTPSTLSLLSPTGGPIPQHTRGSEGG